MKKNQCGFLIALIIVFLLNSILGCKASTEDNPETVDFPSSTAETVQLNHDESSSSSESFNFNYEALSPYARNKVDELMPGLPAYLNTKPKDALILIAAEMLVDVDYEDIVNKQMESDYPELYKVLHHNAKNEPDLGVLDEAYRRQSELYASIRDSYYRPIVLKYCNEEDIIYINDDEYIIIVDINKIYSILENENIEQIIYGLETARRDLLSKDVLIRLYPDMKLFEFQPWNLTAHALNKIQRSLFKELLYTPYSDTLDLEIRFYDSTNAKTKILEKMKIDNPDFYDVYIRYVDSDGSIHTPSNQHDSDLLDSAIDYWFEHMNDIYEPFVKSKALEFCDESCIILDEKQFYSYPVCVVRVKPEILYIAAENPSVESICKYEITLVS